nr:hypothetical protein [uncultured Merdimonas sp.]
MAIGMIMLLCIGMSAVSILGVLLLFLAKSVRVKRAVFYGVSIWGMAIALLSAVSLPVNWTGQQAAAWALGFCSVAGILVHVKAKSRKQYYIAYLLAAISCLGGVLKMFFF